jgi:hypothetical protein
VCDGSGGTTSVADNNDTPKTSNACLEAICTAGVPSNPPEPEGTTCGSGSDACNGSGSCILACGDGIIDNGEQCDGSDLGSATCQSEGFVNGTLTCTASCTFDLAVCSTCGDGIVSGDEACDGSDFGGATCVSLGHAPGNLACSSDCSTIDTSGCTGGFVPANTSFTGTVCDDGLRYEGLNEQLAVCTIDQGIWRGTVENTGTPNTPIDDPVWANADGTTSGQQVTSLLGEVVGTLNSNGHIVFFTGGGSGSANSFGGNEAEFSASPSTWTSNAIVTFSEQIFSTLVGQGANNYIGGWDPVSGQAIVLHGNAVPAACAVNGGANCSFPVLVGSGVTGTVASITSGNDSPSATTLDVHLAVTATQPDGSAATGAGIYWSCDNGNSYVEDDAGMTGSDKALVFKVVADKQTFVTQSTTRTCPTTSNTIAQYASTMYAGLRGGGSLYKTTNGGATWALSNTGLPAGVSVFSIAIDCAATTGGVQGATCANDQLVYAATSAGLYESTDAGAHWALAGLEGSVVHAVVIEASHPSAAIQAGGASETGNTVTFTVAAHDFHVGDPIVVSGVGVAGYNGSFTVASVISSTQFTVTDASTGLAVSGGGTAFLVTPRVFAATDQLDGIFQTNVPVVP